MCLFKKNSFVGKYQKIDWSIIVVKTEDEWKETERSGWQKSCK